MTDLNLGTKRCNNCGQEINQANFIIHESFCLKNILKCELCNLPFDKNLKQEHLEEYHTKVKCDCGELIEKRHLDAHKSELCKKRESKCIYCDLSMSFDKLEEHIGYCGSRTEKCEKCNRFIQLKDFYKHEITKCAFPEKNPEKQPKTVVTSKKVQPVNLSALNANNFFRGSGSKATLPKPALTNEKSFALLPCEFCDEFFTSDLLIDHQNQCELNPEKNNRISIPITRKDGNFTHINDFFQDFEEDESFSEFEYLNKKSLLNAKENTQNDKIPCEFCTELFDVDDLIIHQSICDPTVSQLYSNNSKKNASPIKKNNLFSNPQETSSTHSANLLNQYINPLSHLKITNQNTSINSGQIKPPRSIPFSTIKTRTSPVKSVSKPNENSHAELTRRKTNSLEPKTQNGVNSSNKIVKKPPNPK